VLRFEIPRVFIPTFRKFNSLFKKIIDDIDATAVLSPFLTLLRSPQLSGPFVTLALDAIHTFVSCNIITKASKGVTDTLGDVIDAVSRLPFTLLHFALELFVARCRFVQTDAIGDQLVQLKIIQVLQDIVRSPLRSYLSDESAWDIIDACFSLMISLGIHFNSFHSFDFG
jgi:golgi-specific brefeldin A-resistance guanine nucleotide exchange factor 1